VTPFSGTSDFSRFMRSPPRRRPGRSQKSGSTT
jgi:hypothetical protein